MLCPTITLSQHGYFIWLTLDQVAKRTNRSIKEVRATVFSSPTCVSVGIKEADLVFRADLIHIALQLGTDRCKRCLKPTHSGESYHEGTCSIYCGRLLAISESSPDPIIINLELHHDLHTELSRIAAIYGTTVDVAAILAIVFGLDAVKPREPTEGLQRLLRQAHLAKNGA